MNPLQRALIEKTGTDNGFEHTLTVESETVTLASARYPTRAMIGLNNGEYQVRFQSISPTLQPELQRSFPQSARVSGEFTLTTEASLAALLRRAASLSRALPSQAATDYQNAVAAELAELPAGITGTEVERLVRQRVGQNKFREAMLDYWGGACAVTGVDILAVLRASHAKPWAECASDAERLDVFNGFLLSANLDALFDRFLISFHDSGAIMISSKISATTREILGLDKLMQIRWIAQEHKPYLEYHRARFFSSNINS